ncbi:gluconate kinase [Sphingomonas oleivorans]|uniref:Gluconokinase n=1 Tax=Sphingomonas oleivorans TaxID=1735121 RepID=A0A2T5FVD9_9SPHN|nr:gluconokinase [Sphingomonas oleivorans]PTQ09414.1 gluconate kinase [Sphingomonas oleivorans]
MIIVAMGPSGSGKTTVGRAVAESLGWNFLEGDEFHPPENVAKMSAGIPLTDADRIPWLEAIGVQIGNWIRSGSSGVITCSALKRAYREQLRRSDPDLLFAFLDVPPAVVQARVASRTGHFMPASLVSSQYATLERPGPDENVIPLDASDTVENNVAVIRRALSARMPIP